MENIASIDQIPIDSLQPSDFQTIGSGESFDIQMLKGEEIKGDEDLKDWFWAVNPELVYTYINSAIFAYLTIALSQLNCAFAEWKDAQERDDKKLMRIWERERDEINMEVVNVIKLMRSYEGLTAKLMRTTYGVQQISQDITEAGPKKGDKMFGVIPKKVEI